MKSLSAWARDFKAMAEPVLGKTTNAHRQNDVQYGSETSEDINLDYFISI
jgi:hypothetical protein